MSSLLNRSTECVPLDDPNAWSLVLQWASDAIDFPMLVDSLTKTFGDRYVHDDWRDIYNRVFLLSDPGEDINDADRVRLAITVVETAMASRGVSLMHSGSPTSRSMLVGSKAKGKRKATNTPRRIRPKKRTCSSSVNRFLDTEAVVDEADDSSEDEGNCGGFIVPDTEDPDTASLHVGFPPARVYPVSFSGHAGPSRYQQAVEKIANRFIPSSIAGLDDAEYDRRHDEFYGIVCDEDTQGEEENDDVQLNENTNLKVLDSAGIWDAIREWMFGAMEYPALLELIDFQHDYNPKIQYWENFLSKLAFMQDLNERETLFNSVSLANHLAHLAGYHPQGDIVPSSGSQLPRSSNPERPVLELPEHIGMWAVNIVPPSSVNYITKAWQNASVRSTTHKWLSGRVTVYATCPSQFLHAVPSSHRSNIRGWSLIPFEDRIRFPPPEGSKMPVPGWYIVSKRGLYKNDIGYAIFFDRESTELHLLVAPRRLKPKKLPTDLLCQNPDVRSLFYPEIHEGRQLCSFRGLSRHENSTNIFISGLLLLKLKAEEFIHEPTPSPSQIALHIASLVDPPFMKATQLNYNQRCWKSDDRVTIVDPSHGNTWGHLISVDLENHSALVRLPQGSKYDLPLTSLSRLHQVGDVVRVIPDSFSDIRYIHHPNLGRSGIICGVDPLVDEITIQESIDSQFCVPGFLLESYIPDQPLQLPFGTLASSTNHSGDDTVQVGDVVEIRETGKRGYVIEVRPLDGNLTFVSTDEDTPGLQCVAPISAVRFTPDHRVLKHSPSKGYDVKPGDLVIVMRGEHRGKGGVVLHVRLEEMLLDLDVDHQVPNNSKGSLTLPIIHCAQAHSVQYRDEGDRYLEKEVLIIAGPNKGWRGTLVSCGPDTCVVARRGQILETYKKDYVVVRGLANTLAGRVLTPLQVLQVCMAFARAEIIPDVPERAKTPLPDPVPQSDVAEQVEGSSTSNPWTVNASDRERLNGDPPKLTVHDFMLHPDVAKSLESVRAVFQISPGWRDTYAGRLAKTEVPTPFETTSRPVPIGHLAVRLTARTKGAHLMQEIIPETSLEIYRPVKKNTMCMVIQGMVGGEPIGSLLSVTKVSFKEQRIYVECLNGAPSREATLPFSRVIVVENP